MSAENAAPAIKRAVTMEKLVNLCKRRGIVFPTSDIYGGLGSTFDYGPLGVELKRNVKEAWWREMVQYRSDVLGLDSAIFQHPRTWEASGHLQNFTDPMVDCKACKNRFRADHLKGDKCPECGGELTPARNFNLMFKTFMGPVEETASVVYLRPETAQGIFSNFENVVDTQRVKLPFGVAQQGKSFRNEITTENFIYPHARVRADGDGVFRAARSRGRREVVSLLGRFSVQLARQVRNQGRASAQTRACERRVVALFERHHQSQFLYPFGWGELEGIAKRGSFDLDQHAKFSGRDLTYFDKDTKTRFRPWVIEPALGVDRAMLCFMLDAYDEDVVDNEERIVLRLDPRLAPIKVAVYPLLRKLGQPEKAIAIRDALKRHFTVAYDQAGSIGRRYRRQDEVGTPFGVTVDHQTMEDDTVTIRDRDAMTQERVPVRGWSK